jgi:hypothetical protein
MAINPVHAEVADEYLADLAASVDEVRKSGRRAAFDKRSY